MIRLQRKQVVLCMSIALGVDGAMAAAGWDCQRGADGKEWVCASGKSKRSKPAEDGEASEPTSDSKQAKPEPLPEAIKPKPVEEAEQQTKPSRPVARQQEPATKAELVQPIREPSPRTPAANGLADKKPAEPVRKLKEAAQEKVKSGWSCRPGESKQWDCSLVGPDPRGEAHVVSEGGGITPNWAHSYDMTREDEQRFSGIMAHLPANPWATSCTWNKTEYTPPTEFLMTDADRELRERSPIEINSDRVELVHGEASNYQGSAELVRGDQRLFGNFVTHNKESGALSAQGNVIYLEKGLAYSSDTSLMKLKSDEVVLRNSQFILETVPSRGVARVAHIDSKYKSRYETATYTTCPPGNQDWLLHAKNISIDKESGRGVAKQAWMEFMGVPFLYTPWMSFPVDDRRKSGFLSPTMGHTSTNGFNIIAPYYFNLAPNYDWTFTPRIMTNRGVLLRNEFRYLSESSTGKILAEILPYDNTLIQTSTSNSTARVNTTQEKYGTRGQFGWVGNTRLMDNLKAHVDLHYVSDSSYLNQLGTLLYVNDWRNIRSWGNLSYAEGGFSATLAADAYQTLDPTITKPGRPYRRLPQFTFGYGHEIAGTGLQFQGSGEFVQFDHSVNVTAQRVNLRPSLSYPLKNTWGYLTPRLSLQHTEYWLNWPKTADGLNSQRVYGDTFSRTAPIFSVDSGISFEREFTLGSTAMQQTLEPRLFYLYVPKTNQPVVNFDSAEYDFNFYQLFRENRFAGNDRLSDANQLTPALTTRFIDQDNGLERLKLSLGKIIYFKDPQVTIAQNAAQTTIKSNLVGEVSSMLSDNWSIRSIGQWNPKRDRIDRGQIGLQYNNKANQLLNLSYRYRRDPYDDPKFVLDPTTHKPIIDPKTHHFVDNPLYYLRTVNQTDISMRLPIADGWFALGRWQYSLDSKLTVEAMAGIERETCCWRFSLIGLHYQNGAYGTVATSTTSTNPVSTNDTVFFQVEFKGLGRFGQQVDMFLANSISGFRTDYDTYGTNPQGF